MIYKVSISRNRPGIETLKQRSLHKKWSFSWRIWLHNFIFCAVSARADYGSAIILTYFGFTFIFTVLETVKQLVTKLQQRNQDQPRLNK